MSTRLRNVNWRRQVALVVPYLCAVHLFTQYVGEVRISGGASMLPTLANSGDWVLQESFSHRMNPPRIARGDVIVAISPYDPSRSICKRVMGLPGDTVCVDPTKPVPEHIVVPKGHVWLMGDNYTNSRDSRVYGPVPMGLIRGRIVAKVWPTFTRLKNPTTYIDAHT